MGLLFSGFGLEFGVWCLVLSKAAKQQQIVQLITDKLAIST
jgi:hypothetical protein